MPGGNNDIPSDALIDNKARHAAQSKSLLINRPTGRTPPTSHVDDNNRSSFSGSSLKDDDIFSVDVGSVFTMDVTSQDCPMGGANGDLEELDSFDYDHNDNGISNISTPSNSNRLLNERNRPPPRPMSYTPRSQGQVKFNLNNNKGHDHLRNSTSTQQHGSQEKSLCDDEEPDSFDNNIQGMLSEDEDDDDNEEEEDDYDDDNEEDDASGTTSNAVRINNDNGANRKPHYPVMTRQLSASLPIQVPVNIMKASKGFKASHHDDDDLFENDDESLSDDYAAILRDPSKIPESIEALARSVRDSTEIFGALPSRRFNTGELVRSLRLT